MDSEILITDIDKSQRAVPSTQYEIEQLEVVKLLYRLDSPAIVRFSGAVNFGEFVIWMG
jgi:hypothetical protein